jgi:hypothetical protein
MTQKVDSCTKVNTAIRTELECDLRRLNESIWSIVNRVG